MKLLSKLLPGWRRWLQAWLSPETSPQMDKVLSEYRDTRPVLWLLGKSGSGKSSVVQRLTGDTRAQIGNGFAPCTRTAMFYDYPDQAPVMRFLDTRGIGEADYDPSEDLAVARRGSHALLILTRVDDPSQEALLSALDAMKISKDELAVLHIHTALHTQDERRKSRSIEHNTQQIAKALNKTPESVSIDFTDPDDGLADPDLGLEQLRQAIIDLVPDLAQVLHRDTDSSQESSVFLSIRNEVLWYSGAAATFDVLPAVGLIAVPSVQGKMLHSLAGRYGMQWDKRMAGEFVAAMGASFLYRYLVSLGTRQLVKLIPVYGQSAGAATAASLSFASTYALGRTVCLYLYRRQHSKPVDSNLLRTAFKSAFAERRS